MTTREHGAVAGCGTLLTQPNATITRTSAGHYTAKLPGMGDYQQSPSTVNVTAAGTGNESCSVAAWHVASTDPLSFVYADAYVDVVCINASGTPVDARYTLTYSSFATLCA